MKVEVSVSVPIVETPRVLQVRGMFDVPRSKQSERTWEVDLPLPRIEWSIGLIHGIWAASMVGRRRSPPSSTSRIRG